MLQVLREGRGALWGSASGRRGHEQARLELPCKASSWIGSASFHTATRANLGKDERPRLLLRLHCCGASAAG